MSSRRPPIHLALFLMAYYITNCMYQSYMSLYYTGINFTSAQIGAINAGVALASMAFQPVWGTVGDRTKNRALLLAGLSVASAASVFAFKWFRGFVPLLQPVPPHTSHTSTRDRLISFVQPFAASSKVRVMFMRMSSPCMGTLRRCGPAPPVNKP